MSLLKVVLDRFEDDKAVLVFDDGTQLVIGRVKLAAEFKEGDVLEISISRNAGLFGKRAKLMKNKLAEILNNKNETT